MKLDRFDILNITAASALLAASVLLAFSGGESGVGGNIRMARVAAAAPDALVVQRLQTARLQLESGQVQDSVEALKTLTARYPTLGDAHALLGQAYSRLLDYPAAVKEYRLALLIDPDYVDSKSQKFIGKRIKSTVRDCLPQFRSQAKCSPGDEKTAFALRDALYLERMLAGGCE